MYHNIKNNIYKFLTFGFNIERNVLNKGFTFVELLLAISILATISIIAVQTLYDSVSIRAKQQTIEDSSDSFRSLATLITSSVIEAQNVAVPNPHDIRIIGSNLCQTIKYDAGTSSVLHSVVTDTPCVPADSGFVNVTNEDFIVTNLTFSPVGNNLRVVSMEIEGLYKNSLGDHPVSYKTTVTLRN